MSTITDRPVVRSVIEEFVQDYEWFHTLLGILGNTLFVAGSVCFLLDRKLPASVLFITGSVGMLIGSVGAALVRRARARRERPEAGLSGR